MFDVIHTHTRLQTVFNCMNKTKKCILFYHSFIRNNFVKKYVLNCTTKMSNCATNLTTTSTTTTCFSPPTLNIIASGPARWALLGLYSATSLTSLLGNGILICVLLQEKVSSPSRSIRNYLLNLTVSDVLLAALALPANYANVVLGHWPFPWPRLSCPLGQIVPVLAVFVTSATLSVVSLERYERVKGISF